MSNYNTLRTWRVSGLARKHFLAGVRLFMDIAPEKRIAVFKEKKEGADKWIKSYQPYSLGVMLGLLSSIAFIYVLWTIIDEATSFLHFLSLVFERDRISGHHESLYVLGILFLLGPGMIIMAFYPLFRQTIRWSIFPLAVEALQDLELEGRVHPDLERAYRSIYGQSPPPIDQWRYGFTPEKRKQK